VRARKWHGTIARKAERREARGAMVRRIEANGGGARHHPIAPSTPPTADRVRVMWRSAGWPAARASFPAYVVVARESALFVVEMSNSIRASSVFAPREPRSREFERANRDLKP